MFLGGTPHAKSTAAEPLFLAAAAPASGNGTESLATGALGSPEEREADQVAAQVAAMPAPLAPLAAPPDAPRPPADASPPAEPRVARRAAANGSTAARPSPRVTRAVASADGARPLSSDSRAFLEPRLGASLDGVEVVDTPEGRQAARSLGARAFTVGHRIWLGEGERESDRSLLAHETTHVLQGRSATIQRDPDDHDRVLAQIARFSDPNLVEHWNALDELATIPSGEAIDAILDRVADDWDRLRALDAAQLFFIVQPALALERFTEGLAGARREPVILTLLHLHATRADAAGPAVTTAYGLLETWLDSAPLPGSEPVRDLLMQRQATAIVQRMRRSIADAWWFESHLRDHLGASFFVEAMTELEPRVGAMRGAELGDTLLELQSAELVVAWTASRIEELHDRVIRLVLDEHVPHDSEDLRFIDETLIEPYDLVLSAGSDFPEMRHFFDLAEASYEQQAALYQTFKLHSLRAMLNGASSDEGIGYPAWNVSGLAEPTNDLYSRWHEHRDDVTPRLTAVEAQDAAGESLLPTVLAELQRDVLVVTIEHAALIAHIGLFTVWEQLERAEPDVAGDFDAIQTRIRDYADRIHAAVMGGGDTTVVLGILREPGLEQLQFDIESEVREKEMETRLVALGILALAVVLSAGAAALVEGGVLGGLLLFGVDIGSGGLMALEVGTFAVEVGAFTLSHEALSSAAFGRPIDWSAMPTQLVENAILFGAFRGIGALTGRLFRGVSSTGLRGALAFGARHGINLATFAGVGSIVERVHSGHWPTDWQRFLEDTTAAYLVLGIVSAGMGRLRTAIRQRLLVEPRLQLVEQHLARMETLQAQISAGLEGVASPPPEPATGEPATGEPATGEPARAPVDPELLRQQLIELAGEARQAATRLREAGIIGAEEEAGILDAANAVEAQVVNIQPGSGRSEQLPDFAALEGFTGLGDGRTFLIDVAAAGDGLGRTLADYRRAGYRVERIAETGETEVLDAQGTLVARILPDLRARTTSATLTGLGVPAELVPGLSRLPADSFPMLRRLDPTIVVALGEVALTSTETADTVLRSSTLQALARNPPMAARFVHLVALLGSFELADTHVHTVGALPPAETFLNGLTRAGTARALERSHANLVELVDRLLEMLPEGPERTAKTEAWEALRPRLAALRDAVAEQIEANESRQETADLADELAPDLQRILEMRVEGSEVGPRMRAFFTLFGEVGRAGWSGGPRGQEGPRQRGGMQTAARGEAGRRVAYLELRQGLGTRLIAELTRQGAILESGELAPDVRIVLSQPRRSEPMPPEEAEALLDSIEQNPILRNAVVGFDLSGVELTGGVGYERFGVLGRAVIARNFARTRALLEANPGVLAEVEARLGGDVLARGDALVADMTSSSRPRAEGGETAEAQLAQIVRVAQEQLAAQSAEEGVSVEGPSLFGLTMHAGEQVASESTTIGDLLADVSRSVDSGADRLGHGLVLMIPLPSGLRQLGFRWRPTLRGIVWERPRPGGAVESYTSDQVAALETERIALIGRIADLGIVIESQPTSNIVLSGLDPAAFPIQNLFDVRPDVRVSVSTDNPALHGTDPATELALLSVSTTGGFGLTVRIFLEGYDSRLGRRNLTDPGGTMQRARDALVAQTPPEARSEVLRSLFDRYGLGEDPGEASLSREAFAEALDPYLLYIFQ